jgi:hypothetical protein
MINMDNLQNEKAAIANFLGSIMNKSKEIDSGTVVPVSKQNNDILISKVASEIDAKFASSTPSQMPPQGIPGGVDVAAQMIPYDAPLESLGIEPAEAVNNSTEPPTPPTPPANNVQPVANQIDPDQLEFDFTEPNVQTNIIVGEINLLNNKLNRILSMVEELQAVKRPTAKRANKDSTKKVAKKK